MKAALLFALPAAIYMLVFVGYPMIQNFILSFKNVDVYTFADASKQAFVGFENYKELLRQGCHPVCSNYNTLIFTGIHFFQFLLASDWHFCSAKSSREVLSLGESQ